MSILRVLSVLSLPLLLGGCISNSVVNLTPRQAVRTPDNLYLVEASWKSNEQALRPDSLEPKVMIGTQFYPMERTPNTKNRWEALVPGPADARFFNYRFKFDYLYNAIPIPRRDSKLSPTYQLEIVD